MKKIRIKADLTKDERDEYKRIYDLRDKLAKENPEKTVVVEKGTVKMDGTTIDKFKNTDDGFLKLGLSDLRFSILSWNIEGKHYILKNDKVKKILSNHDILFIHETHCTREMEIKMENYISFQHPCVFSTPEKPRGGCIMFVKDHLMKFVEDVDKNFNDSITIYMSQNIVLCGFLYSSNKQQVL